MGAKATKADPGQRLKALARQVQRARRADLARLRQREILLALLVDSMIEFGITPAVVSHRFAAAVEP